MMTGFSRRSIITRLIRRSLQKSLKIKGRLANVSNNYPFLSNRKTILHLRTSKVCFIMRGLPGSGKSTVVQAIKLQYKNALVVSADNYFSQDDGSYEYNKEKLSEAHENCRKTVEQAVKRGLRHLVVDNTNIMRWEMGEYFRLADLFSYMVLIVEPSTPWAMDPSILAAKNTHNVPEDHIKIKLKKFLPVLPAYWAWFLNERDSRYLLSLGENAFELCLKNVAEFSSYMNEQAIARGFTVPISFQEYYQCDSGKNVLLHCTAFHSGRGKNRDPKTGEYASRDEVKNSYGRVFDLKLLAIMITPRSVGIRVALSKNQLALWGAEDVWRPVSPPNAEDKASDGKELPLQKDDVSKIKKEKRPKKQDSKSSVKKVKNPKVDLDIEDDISFHFDDATRELNSEEIQIVTESMSRVNLETMEISESDANCDAQYNSIVETAPRFDDDQQKAHNLTDMRSEFADLLDQDLSKNSGEDLSDDLLTVPNVECPNEDKLEVSNISEVSSEKGVKEKSDDTLYTPCDVPLQGVNCDTLVGDAILNSDVSNSLSFQHCCPSEHFKETVETCGDVSASGREMMHLSEISMKRGSRAHVTLGVTKEYKSVHCGFDQMELLLCEEKDSIVGEPVVTDEVTILHFGEGRCAVYFDWPVCKTALFTGKY